MTTTKQARTLDSNLADQISKIVEEVEDSTNPIATETAKFYYRMPWPGVRYYSFVGEGSGNSKTEQM